MSSGPVFSEPGTSFRQLGLSPGVCDNLTRVGVVRPTKIQEQGIPVILKGEDAVIAAETGSGKTLTYLAPLAHILHEHNASDLSKPSGLVLVPTQELVVQVVAVAR